MQKQGKSIPFTNANFIKELHHYKHAFTSIESQSLSKYDYPSLKQLIEKEFNIPLLQNYYPRAQQPSTYYRVRKAASFSEKPDCLSSYTMPPPEVTKKARANFEGYPVFYCAALPQTAVAECHVQDGDDIFLSIWKLKAGHTLGINSFMINSKTLPSIWSEAIQNYERHFSNKIGVYEEGVKESIWYINHKLSDWFLRLEDYSLSAFLGHYFLYDTDLSIHGMSVDAILYPSIAQQQQGINLAFSPNGLKKLELQEVVCLRYKNSTAKGAHGYPIKVGKLDGVQNKIVWEKA